MRLFDGCSNGLYRLELSGQRLAQGRRLGDLSTCSPAPMTDRAMRRAARRLGHFYAVLHGPATWHRDGSTLTVTTPGRGSVELRTDDRPAPEVIGTTWALVDFRPASSDISYSGWLRLLIDADGSFATDGVCPPIRGRADVRVDKIRFHPRHVGPYACPVPMTGAEMQAAVSTALQKALRGHVMFAIRGNELMLDAGRRGFLVFRAVTA